MDYNLKACNTIIAVTRIVVIAISCFEFLTTSYSNDNDWIHFLRLFPNLCVRYFLIIQFLSASIFFAVPNYIFMFILREDNVYYEYVLAIDIFVYIGRSC